jgi:hypothetical protein
MIICLIELFDKLENRNNILFESIDFQLAKRLYCLTQCHEVDLKDTAEQKGD